MYRFNVLMLLSAFIFIGILSQTKIETQSSVTATKLIDPKDPPCIQVYYCIEHYATKYKIPKRYAYAIAYYESGYKGPMHWEYNHAVTSHAGASGPMQIMPIADVAINNNHNAKRLTHDVEYNIKTSMKMLRKLYDMYNDWPIVFGYYNTGQKQVNHYSELITSFKPNWRWIRC